MTSFTHPHRLRGGFWLPCLLALAGACSGSDGSPQKGGDPTHPPPGKVVPGDNAEDFISEVPGQGAGRNSAPTAAEGDAASDAGAGGDGSAERAITEADILKVEGDTLYALSRYAGLSIIDISRPNALVLLGNYRTNAMPFEMYLENGVAYVMYNDWGSYEYDATSKSWSWQSASRMIALDVSTPSRIKRIAEQVVGGSIADSRKVGDIIYLVTYENGYCWECEDKPATRVVSFDTSDRTKFTRVDQLRFDGDESSWQRSISVNQERIYVAGPSWDDKDSDIQVVDISDPKGDLKLGADIPIHGSVQSRWQMDEYEGVLRVISQPTAWRSDDPPHVQTFSVKSSSVVTPLADLAMKLPRIEDLQSVRFDGPRAYAVTFQQTDPLFTFDLSDPALPKQVGELVIPGFVVHMEPRDDRIYALGHDFQNQDGALHVSIFDVSVLAQPTMLSRVNFGGDWAWLAEDQDRIHKAFNLALDAGMIFVPFGGGSWDDQSCHYSYQSGIQIIDVAKDTLKLRGVAPQIGEARRSFLHENRLFGITDNAVQVFDITNRDKPAEIEKLEVARNIDQVHVLGDKLLRFGTDWWTNRAVLDFAKLDRASTAQPVGELDLTSLGDAVADECVNGSYWQGNVYVHGETAYVPRSSYSYDEKHGSYSQKLELFVVDLRDRSAPKLAGSFSIEANGEESLGGVVLTDSALLVGRSTGYYNYDPKTGERSKPTYSYDVFDLANPLSPQRTTRYEVPSDLAFGGWGYGAMGCGVDMAWGWWFPYYGTTSALVSGDIVVSQHEESVDDGSGRVRYYLDRLDVSDPSHPKLLEPINIPGQIVQYDQKAGRALTLDYLYSEVSASQWDDCYGFANSYFDDTEKVCRIYERRLNALRIHDDVATRVSMLTLDGDRLSSYVSVSDERVFYTTYARNAWNGDAPPSVELESLAFTSEAQLTKLPTLKLDDKVWWYSQVYARDKRAFISHDGGLGVADTADPTAPTYVDHDLQGWGCNSLEVAGDRAYCALGMFGVATIEL